MKFWNLYHYTRNAIKKISAQVGKVFNGKTTKFSAPHNELQQNYISKTPKETIGTQQQLPQPSNGLDFHYSPYFFGSHSCADYSRWLADHAPKLYPLAFDDDPLFREKQDHAERGISRI